MHYKKVFYIIIDSIDSIILCTFFLRVTSASKMTGLCRLGMTVLKNHFTCSKRKKIDNLGFRKKKRNLILYLILTFKRCSRKLQLYLFFYHNVFLRHQGKHSNKAKLCTTEKHLKRLHSSFHLQILPLLTIIHQFCLLRGHSGHAEKQYTYIAQAL